MVWGPFKSAPTSKRSWKMGTIAGVIFNENYDDRKAFVEAALIAAITTMFTISIIYTDLIRIHNVNSCSVYGFSVQAWQQIFYTFLYYF